MKYQVLFFLKSNENYYRLLSAAVVTGSLSVKQFNSLFPSFFNMVKILVIVLKQM